MALLSVVILIAVVLAITGGYFIRYIEESGEGLVSWILAVAVFALLGCGVVGGLLIGVR